jgi:hypothetical protein
MHAHTTGVMRGLEAKKTRGLIQSAGLKDRCRFLTFARIHATTLDFHLDCRVLIVARNDFDGVIAI